MSVASFVRLQCTNSRRTPSVKRPVHCIQSQQTVKHVNDKTQCLNCIFVHGGNCLTVQCQSYLSVECNCHITVPSLWLQFQLPPSSSTIFPFTLFSSSSSIFAFWLEVHQFPDTRLHVSCLLNLCKWFSSTKSQLCTAIVSLYGTSVYSQKATAIIHVGEKVFFFI